MGISSGLSRCSGHSFTPKDYKDTRVSFPQKEITSILFPPEDDELVQTDWGSLSPTAACVLFTPNLWHLLQHLLLNCHTLIGKVSIIKVPALSSIFQQEGASDVFFSLILQLQSRIRAVWRPGRSIGPWGQDIIHHREGEGEFAGVSLILPAFMGELKTFLLTSSQ